MEIRMEAVTKKFTLDELYHAGQILENLYRLTSQRQIPHYKIGGRVLFSEEKLWDWLEQRSITAQR